MEFVPALALVTVRLTVYLPCLMYVYSGLCAVDVPVSPKDHDHETGDPSDWSVNCTASGLIPDVVSLVNSAISGREAVM